MFFFFKGVEVTFRMHQPFGYEVDDVVQMLRWLFQDVEIEDCIIYIYIYFFIEDSDLIIELHHLEKKRLPEHATRENQKLGDFSYCKK